MNNTEKVKTFEAEINLIQNKEIKNFTTKAVKSLPAYFFVIPASSSGKYHPQYALGEGGLVRHVKACVMLVQELFRMEEYGKFSSDEKDLIIASLILHDGLKSGLKKSDSTVSEHPLLMAEHVKGNKSLQNIIPTKYMDTISDNILTHMGQWRYQYKTGKAIMPKPKTKAQKLIHLTDYLCSRKFLEVTF
jgi:hypothetical protein